MNKVLSLKDVELSQELKKEYASVIGEMEKHSYDPPWSNKSILKEIENKSSFLMFTEDMELMGYIFYRESFLEIEVLRFTLGEKFQGRGHGTKFLKEFLKRFLKFDFILDVDIRNNNAIKIYESLGFVKICERFDFYGHGLNGYTYVKKFKE